MNEGQVLRTSEALTIEFLDSNLCTPNLQVSQDLPDKLEYLIYKSRVD